MTWFNIQVILGLFVTLNRFQARRTDSSNFNPVPFWLSGVQMVALNFQTCDKELQINRGKRVELPEQFYTKPIQELIFFRMVPAEWRMRLRPQARLYD